MVASTWLRRSVSAADHYENRARVRDWGQAIEDAGRRHKGESKKAYRRRLIQRVCALSTALKGGMEDLTERQQEDMTKAMVEWQEDCRKKAENNEFIPVLSSIHLSDFEAQFLSELVPGMDEYFVCRQRTCLTVTHNTSWIHNSPNGQYLCPSCAQQYRPWKMQPGYCKANKVFIVDLRVRPEARPIAVAASSEAVPPGAVAASSEAVPGGAVFGEAGAEYCAYPTIWADTATSTLTNKFKEITCDADTKLENMAPARRLEYVNQFIDSKGHRGYFKPTQLSATVMQEADQRNARMEANCPTQWKYDHLRAGFQTLNLDESVMDEPLSQADLILMWGMATWMVTQAQMHKLS